MIPSQSDGDDAQPAVEFFDQLEIYPGTDIISRHSVRILKKKNAISRLQTRSFQTDTQEDRYTVLTDGKSPFHHQEGGKKKLTLVLALFR